MGFKKGNSNCRVQNINTGRMEGAIAVIDGIRELGLDSALDRECGA